MVEILSRLHDFAPHDDGHAVKLSRAAVITQQISENYNDRDWKIIKGDEMWMRIHHLIADSVEAPGPKFVRTAGLDEAWVVSILFGIKYCEVFKYLHVFDRTFPKKASCDTSRLCRASSFTIASGGVGFFWTVI